MLAHDLPNATTKITSPAQMNITYLQLFISLLYLHVASLAKAQHRDIQTRLKAGTVPSKKRHFMQTARAFNS